MNLTDFLSDLLDKGIRLWGEGELLRYRAPAGAMTKDIRAVLAERKADLLKFLQLSNQIANAAAPAIVPTLRNGKAPLSYAQERLWFLDRLRPGSTVYNIPRVVRLVGRLDIGALERAVNEIERRHEILRTTFGMSAEGPVQVVREYKWEALGVVDLMGLEEGERERAARGLIEQESGRLFDLSRGPLWRMKLLLLGPEEQAIAYALHHIVSDGWSTGVLNRELEILYEAYAGGGGSPLEELAVQYADFAIWQRGWLQGEVLGRQLEYWRKALVGISPLQLPTDYLRPAIQTFKGAIQEVSFSEATAVGLRELSQREGVTLFMTLLAGFKVLLSRYSGQWDIAVGTPIANRNRGEIEGLIGFFVNTLVLRTDLSGDPTVSELLGRVKEVSLGAYGHQDLPFEMLVEELRPERDMSRNPLVQVIFALQNAPDGGVAMKGIKLEPMSGGQEGTRFDLELYVREQGEGMTGWINYNTDLFGRGTMKRLAGHLERLLEQMVNKPGCRLSELEMLSEAERRQLLEEWNDTKREYPRDKCLHEVFEEQVERTPGNVAVEYEGQELTYRELNERANRLAHYLRGLGVGPEMLVGVYMDRSLELMVGLLGVLKAGGAYLPLEPACPKERLAFMLEDAQVSIVLTGHTLAEKLPAQCKKVIYLDRDWAMFSQQSAANPEPVSGPLNLAYVIYTSGSTGVPKGVMIQQRALLNYLFWSASTYDVARGKGTLVHSPINFDLTITALFPPLIIGQKVTLAPKGEGIKTIEEAFRGKHELSLIKITPAHLGLLERMISSENAAELTNTFVVGGEALLAETLPFWITHAPKTRIINEYGPTETVVGCCVYQIGETDMQKRAIPIGRPIANVRMHVLAHLEPVPVGIPAELYIGGEGVGRGYLGRPDLTSERFIPDQFNIQPGARLYKTGDLGRYLADGNIEFLGRIDEQIKIRGFRIELGEIEATLGKHPTVQEHAIVLKEEELGEKKLIGYITFKEGSSATSNDLKSFLKERLPEYMVPGTFVVLEKMPLTLNGKVDRKALPAFTETQSAKAYVAPRTPIEKLLAGLFQEVLKVEQVGIHDNFFELGGHSLLSLRLLILIEKRTGQKLPLTAIIQGPTVERLAGAFSQNAIPETPPPLMAFLLEKRLGKKLPQMDVFQKTGTEYLAGVVRQQNATGPQSSLVAIQTRGNRLPFFIVHPGGGHVFSYIRLAQFLGTDQPCYGLQARGLPEGHEPHTRIEDMAAYYIRALQTVQPVGPYHLGGWCMGGVVAFEMAQQLHSQGQRVALLALLDTHISASGDTPPTEEADDIRFFFGGAFDPMASLTEIPKDQDQQLSFMLQQGKKAGLVPPEIDLSQARHFVGLVRSNRRATRNYKPRRYPGRITLFKAGETPEGLVLDPALGWNEWADDGVEVHVVPGKHNNLLHEPHGEILAAKLTACLHAASSSERQEAESMPQQSF